MSAKVLDLLEEKLGAGLLERHAQFGDDTAVIDPSRWREAAFFLRDDPRVAMNMFVDLCGVDFLPIGGVGALAEEPGRGSPNPSGGRARFEVVCHLRSLQHAHRVRIKTRVGNDEGENAEVDSLVPVWRGADWFERETFDMFGVIFKGHPDLRRILMYPEFVGHPLRKDYPADRIQPLIPFRDDPDNAFGKQAPFGPDEGLSFGRQSHDWGTQNGGSTGGRDGEPGTSHTPRSPNPSGSRVEEH